MTGVEITIQIDCNRSIWGQKHAEKQGLISPTSERKAKICQRTYYITFVAF